MTEDKRSGIVVGSTGNVNAVDVDTPVAVDTPINVDASDVDITADVNRPVDVNEPFEVDSAVAVDEPFDVDARDENAIVDVDSPVDIGSSVVKVDDAITDVDTPVDVDSPVAVGWPVRRYVTFNIFTFETDVITSFDLVFDIVVMIYEVVKKSDLLISDILVIISEVDSVNGMVDSVNGMVDSSILVDALVAVVVAENNVISGLIMSEIINIVFDSVESTQTDVLVWWMEYSVNSVIPDVMPTVFDDVIILVTISSSEFVVVLTSKLALHSFLEKVQVEHSSSDSGELFSDK